MRNRRSNRLKGYDYSQDGYYFVTICARDRKEWFGEIRDGKMNINHYGNVVWQEWIKTGEIRKNVTLDEFIVMPNHVHGIIIIHDCRGTARRDTDVGAYGHTPLQTKSFRSPSMTIGAIVRGFKSAVTKQINDIRGTRALPVWQRNYYEHIIRNEIELDKIRCYIRDNPLHWQMDDYFI